MNHGMTSLKLTISCDDVNPSKEYRLLGTKAETWFRKLNEEFGVKFDLFVPSNFHQKNPIREHGEWVSELSSINWLSLNAHGHYHMTSEPKIMGECEMLELDTIQKAKSRFDMMIEEWDACGVKPVGWRNPGWLCHPVWNQFVNNNGDPLFEYVAIHYEHNRGMEWNCKTFFGHDGIQQDNIAIHNGDMIMFQSHIAGNHNHNVWNENNYEQLRLSLSHLFGNYEIEPKLLAECLND